MCLKSCFHSLKNRPIQVNVSQSCFHSLNNYSSLIIFSTSGDQLKSINCIISDRRIPLLAGIPLCKSQELSRREHSTSRLCNIHHDIPLTMHTPAACGRRGLEDWGGVFVTIAYESFDGSKEGCKRLLASANEIFSVYLRVTMSFSIFHFGQSPDIATWSPWQFTHFASVSAVI